MDQGTQHFNLITQYLLEITSKYVCSVFILYIYKGVMIFKKGNCNVVVTAVESKCSLIPLFGLQVAIYRYNIINKKLCAAPKALFGIWDLGSFYRNLTP